MYAFMQVCMHVCIVWWQVSTCFKYVCMYANMLNQQIHSRKHVSSAYNHSLTHSCIPAHPWQRGARDHRLQPAMRARGNVAAALRGPRDKQNKKCKFVSEEQGEESWEGCWAAGPSPLPLGLSHAAQGKLVVADTLRALPSAPVPSFTATLRPSSISSPCR